MSSHDGPRGGQQGAQPSHLAVGSGPQPALPPTRKHKYRHDRGYLPHFDVPGLVQFITFRLADSLPRAVAAAVLAKAESPERRQKFKKLLAAGLGSCLLRRPEVAAIVVRALQHFDGDRYRLLAWCVMPNHVHVLVELPEGSRLGDVVHSWKSFTAKQINRLCGTTGQLWQQDYFDRAMRDERQLRNVVRYIEQNPVKAGLVAHASAWAASSAAACAAGDEEPRLA